MSEGTSNQRPDIYHLVGTTLKGRYTLEEFVDEGGMSVVYRARDVESNSIVAVKILAPRFLARPQQAEIYLKLFRQEAELAQKLKHPNIVSVYDSGVENNTAFIVMEWLEGRTLGEEITSSGRPSLTRTADILRQICAALDAAHRQKIIHLDLKPNNIFLLDSGTPNERVKVIDFGLSRIIQSTLGTTISRVIGTPYYIAPEVFTKKAGRLSDIYSLGVVTYELLTGLMPFGTSDIYALMQQHIERAPPSARAANPEIPEYVDDLIRRTLSKTPTRRPQSADEFYKEFTLGLRHVELKAEGRLFQPVVYSSVPLSVLLRRHRKALNKFALYAATLLLTLSAIFSLYPLTRLTGFDLFPFSALSRFIAVAIYFAIGLRFALDVISREDIYWPALIRVVVWIVAFPLIIYSALCMAIFTIIDNRRSKK